MAKRTREKAAKLLQVFCHWLIIQSGASMIVVLARQPFYLLICLNRMLSASANASYVSETWHKNTNEAVQGVKCEKEKQI